MGKRKKKLIKQTEIPPEFFAKLAELYEPSIVEKITATFHRKPTTFRVNTLRTAIDDVTGSLQRDGFVFEPVPWLEGAYILRNKTKRELIDHPLYEAGKIYVQSLASMVPPVVLDPQPGERVLDLTAAPGSKTSQMAAMMERQGELVANDKSRIRFFKLQHNMEKLGVSDPADYWTFTLRMEPGNGLVQEYPEHFDRILLDAPCSGEARFDTDNPKTFSYWSPRKVKEMAFVQRKLLLSAWQALRPGGTLVYSTCTISPEENELQIARLLARYEDAVLERVEIPGVERLPIMTTWQGRDLAESLVTCCLRVAPTADIESFFVTKIKKLS